MSRIVIGTGGCVLLRLRIRSLVFNGEEQETDVDLHLGGLSQHRHQVRVANVEAEGGEGCRGGQGGSGMGKYLA